MTGVQTCALPIFTWAPRGNHVGPTGKSCWPPGEITWAPRGNHVGPTGKSRVDACECSYILICQPHKLGLDFGRFSFQLSTFNFNLYLGGYSAEVPPLPIPNRVVKLSIADGTACCGRVGSRHFRSPMSFDTGDFVLWLLSFRTRSTEGTDGLRLWVKR